jgi:SEC-C motif
MASTGNNLRHGFRSSVVLLPSDDRTEYEALHAELTAHFGPEDLTETRLIREMADAEWRLRRVRSLLHSALVRRMATLAEQDPALAPLDLESKAIETLAETGCSYGTWLRYESKFERQYERAYKEWTTYQNGRRRIAEREAAIAIKNAIAAPAPDKTPVSNVQNEPAQQHAAIARNAPCPCESGEKYKRCCGKSAPPVLSKAA